MIPRVHQGGASDYGKLGFGFALTTTYGLICDLGISFFIIKAVARAPARAGEMLSNALAVRISLGLVATIAVLATLAILDYDSTTETVCLVLSVGMVLGGAANSLRGTLQGGIIPKLGAAVTAARGGVNATIGRTMVAK